MVTSEWSMYNANYVQSWFTAYNCIWSLLTDSGGVSVWRKSIQFQQLKTELIRQNLVKYYLIDI